MPLITVILPTCDRPALLPRAVASVLRQTEPDFELLLIDNNRREPPLLSQAETLPGWDDPRIRVLAAPLARSASAVRNVGLDAARGRWVTYLDDDDTYRPEKLARQLARARAGPDAFVLCGGCFHLRGRERRVQCTSDRWSGDDLLLRARWNTPLLFHPHPGAVRFDEGLGSGEDAEFAHRLLAQLGADAVAVVPEPLVDIYPQPGAARVNVNAAPWRRAAARILAVRRSSCSRAARRRYVLRVLLGQAKLERRTGRCARLSARLLAESGGADWRVCANALAFSVGLFPDRWVS